MRGNFVGGYMNAYGCNVVKPCRDWSQKLDQWVQIENSAILAVSHPARSHATAKALIGLD